MTVMPGQIAPDFEQDTANGSIRLHQWLGQSWGMLFSHPQDLASAYAAELIAVARLRADLERRDVKPIGLARCAAASHERWQSRFASLHGQEVGFPLIADADGTVCDLYGLAHPDDPLASVCGLFIIDDRKLVRVVLTYAEPSDRDFDDILRLIDRLRRGPNARAP